MQSMTGFGEGSASDSLRQLRVELRSVNHRFRDVAVHVPRNLMFLEEALRKLAALHFERGRVEIFVYVEDLGQKERTVRIDRGLLRGFWHALHQAKRELSLDEEPGLDILVNMPGIFIVDEPEVDREALLALCSSAFRQAALRLAEARSSEGKALEADILHRLNEFEQLIKRISERAPAVVLEYRERLRSEVSRLLQGGPLDEGRIAMEVVLLAERVAVDEEISRSFSHARELRTVTTSAGAVGRRLEFLLQEVHRELTTLSNKLSDAAVSQMVVEAKAEVEKMREQAGNVE